MANDLSARSSRGWRIGRAASGLVGLAFAIVYLLEGRNLDVGRLNAPGPGIFPLIVGILFAVVSVGVVADALLTARPGKAQLPEGKDLRRLCVVFGAFVVYVAVFAVLGFLVSTVLLVMLFTRVVGGISWLKAIASGVGVALLVWAVFAFVLGVQLPTPMWS